MTARYHVKVAGRSLCIGRTLTLSTISPSLSMHLNVITVIQNMPFMQGNTTSRIGRRRKRRRTILAVRMTSSSLGFPHPQCTSCLRSDVFSKPESDGRCLMATVSFLLACALKRFSERETQMHRAAITPRCGAVDDVCRSDEWRNGPLCASVPKLLSSREFRGRAPPSLLQASNTRRTTLGTAFYTRS